MITEDDLYRAYLDCRKNKRSTQESIEFEMNLESNLYELWKDIEEGTYKPSRSKCFVVLKPKPREVFAANFRDRIIHHLIYNEINECIDSKMRNNVFNCRVGRGVQYGVETLRKEMYLATKGYKVEKYIVRCDLRNFFPSINKDILYGRLEDFLKENYRGNSYDQVMWLIRETIYNDPKEDCNIRSKPEYFRMIPKEKSMFYAANNKSLAIGNLTSQLFASFLLMGLDEFIADRSEYCGRYVDDFYMIGNRGVIKNVPYISGFLGKYDIVLHPYKIYVQPCRHGAKFIGYNIKYLRIHNGNRTIYNALSEARKDEPSMESLNSYLGFMRHYNMRKVQCKVLDSIRSEFWDNHTINGDPLYIKKNVK